MENSRFVNRRRKGGASQEGSYRSNPGAPRGHWGHYTATQYLALCHPTHKTASTYKFRIQRSMKEGLGMRYMFILYYALVSAIIGDMK